MARPLLDVSDVLLDPDFCDTTLVCTRNTQTVDNGGLGQTSTEDFSFSGVVTSDRGKKLNRRNVGEHATDSILIITTFQLIPAGPDRTADIVTWEELQWTVTAVNSYSTYGPGFVEATCEMIPLSG